METGSWFKLSSEGLVELGIEPVIPSLQGEWPSLFTTATPDLLFIFQELELLPVKELQNNIYIKHPVSMEQYLMEGSYNKVSEAVLNRVFILGE